MTNRSMPPNTPNLPAGYQTHGTLDLKEDKKANLAIQLIFALIVLVMVGLAVWLRFPTRGAWSTGMVILVTVLMALAYIVVHELTHGVVMQAFSGVRTVYSFRFPFAATGSTAYFNKASFVIIALVPAVLWGIVLIALLLLLPPDFFLSVYILIGLNFAGAAGDYVQVYVTAKLPRMALIQDDGKQSRVFLPRG
ncbi:MAG: DUF3267 domain-containing protein [Eubacteriales bacterium]|nr:DUF3267 domain-containing protein [Eubacteriales bacterium]